MQSNLVFISKAEKFDLILCTKESVLLMCVWSYYGNRNGSGHDNFR